MVEVIAVIEGQTHGAVVAIFPLSLIRGIYDASKAGSEMDLA